MKTTTTLAYLFLSLCITMQSHATIGDELRKLTHRSLAEYDRFGTSVTISGNTALVGVPEDDGNGVNSGSAYLFDITTGRALDILKASDGAAEDYFGSSVGISGNTAIVGASWDDDNGEDSGSAYLFDITTGAELAKLTPSDGAANDYFGSSVGISGNTAIVGAWGDDDNGEDSGSAYLFDVTTGAELAKLKPRDGVESGNFGSVAISGNMAIVGAPGDDDNGVGSGSAYLYFTTGAGIAKLTPLDGAESDGFGLSVAIDGHTAIVSALGSDSGSAYLFDVITGAELAKLTPSDGGDDYSQSFGSSVGISGNTAIVGEPLDDENGYWSGSAYLFDVTTGAELLKLTASDADDNDRFGTSVGISGNMAIVGAPEDSDSGLYSGSVYVFSTGPAPRKPGDFDNDGNVDGADFLLWQRDTGVGDLANWQANYGDMSPLASSGAVPEPTSWMLLSIAATAFRRRYRNRP